MRIGFVAALALVVGCGPGSGRGRVTGDPTSPDAGESMQNDPNVDHDGDGFSVNAGDCNDMDATIYPGATETCDGKDHNCNGVVDDICDDDKDGYAVCPASQCADVMGNLPGGDCNDDDPLVNPGAMEVQGDNVDNNCNGVTDEAQAKCDGNPKQSDPKSYAGAIELCAPWLVSAKLNADADARSHDVRVKYGANYKPKAGSNFVMLSTGIAADKADAGWVEPQPGTAFVNDDQNPLPMANNNACFNGPDEQMVHDYVELTLTIKVPTNAQSFSFSFMFASAEYPEFVGTEFNDKFLAVLDSKAFKGNVSFDKNMNPITVNAGFFDVCTSAPVCGGQKMNTCTKPVTQLNQTGFEDDAGGTPVGGGTGWLTTTAPVKPGETATLRFIIFDEGDHIYDSSVIIDDFQFQVMGSMGPNTVG